MASAITLGTAQQILDVAEFLRKNPWSTRRQIEDALSIDTRKLAQILLSHMDLRMRPRDAGKQRPLVYALPEIPPNPFSLKGSA